MNIFNHYRQAIGEIVGCLSASGDLPPDLGLDRISVEPPRDPSHGDISTNVAMVLAKPAKRKPRELAELIAAGLRDADGVKSVEIAEPGFINLRLEAGLWQRQIAEIVHAGIAYGDTNIGAGQPINVEYVSANPTGPMHVGHARGAVIGDVLASLLSKAGFDVTREYYINDAGVQVDVLARSAYLRYREALGEVIGEIPDGLYPGDYLVAVGESLAASKGDALLSLPEEEWLPDVRDLAIGEMMALIREDLAALGIEHQVFRSERSLHDDEVIAAVVSDLEARDLVYWGTLEPPKGQLPDDWEEREQLLFRATDFGDDIDRPLQKSDGSWTYFASDVAYHHDKLQRTGGALINVWGADHGGYVKRMKAATQAISGQKDMLDIKLCQLVSLLDRGKPVKMSKRAGTFVTLSDVMEAVGADVMRFIMLTRRNDQTLEFDYAKVTEKSRENPVFYVQYAHARGCSVLRQDGLPDWDRADLSLLQASHEVRLIKQLVSWPQLVRSAANSHEPHKIAFYLIDLAALFHGLWTAGREDPSLRFILESDAEMTAARLSLVQAAVHVLYAGLNLLSVNAPEEM